MTSFGKLRSLTRTEIASCGDEFYLDGLNCEPYSFDAACQQLNREYQKNKTRMKLNRTITSSALIHGTAQKIA
mgnify:CR=1 FL=1